MLNETKKNIAVLSAVAALNADTGKPVRCKDIAGHYKTARRFFESTCYTLSGEGWLESVTGPDGGYRLSDTAKRKGPTGYVREALTDQADWMLGMLKVKSSVKFIDLASSISFTKS